MANKYATSQPITANNWQPITIGAEQYCNPEPLTGFQINSGPQGNPLHPETVPGFESHLKTDFTLQNTHKPELNLTRLHIEMPQLNPNKLPAPGDYQPVESPRSLCTTSVTAALVAQQDIQQASIGYHFVDDTLHDLKTRLNTQAEQGEHYRGLCGNLGYFMTGKLNCGDHPWSHRQRFPEPECQLPEVLSYLGFYHFAADGQQPATSGFQGAHSGAVAVTRSGQLEIIPQLSIDSYQLTIHGQALNVDAVNPDLSLLSQRPIALFTPAYPLSHSGELAAFSPRLALDGRVNLFIANRGDGQRPHEQIIKIWHGSCPLPSFGALLSLEQELFAQLFAGLTDQELMGSPVTVVPHSSQQDLNNYRQILGGLVPAVIDGKTIVPTGPQTTAQQAEAALNGIALTDTPLARAGKETNNFDAQIREPAGLFIQTETQVGWLLFDGRHEMSIGANIVDTANLVQRLQQDDIDLFNGEKLLHALVVDGGSAMKAYAVDTHNSPAGQCLLNRVAAGGRNGPGSDPQGLNLYSTAILKLK